MAAEIDRTAARGSTARRSAESRMRALFREHSDGLRHALADLDAFYEGVRRVVLLILEMEEKGRKLLIAGNGGSAAEAQHLSDELVGRFRSDRRPFPAIALTADPMVLTCIGNDYGFERIFDRQIAAHGRKGDIFLGLTTSGSSRNILNAAAEARRRGLAVVAFMGRAGPFSELADVVVAAPSDRPAVVQELHLHAIHLICEALEPA